MGKKLKNIISIMALGIIISISFGTVVKADKYNTWSTYGYYGVDEDVCSEFEEKNTNSAVKLNIKNCTGTMDFKVVGALAARPVDGYSDCSAGRVERVYASTDDQVSYLENMVNEWNYPYAGVLGMAVTDDNTSAWGYFRADCD